MSMGATGPGKEKRLVERIADAVLYEGYILYPYRPSAVKNQQRWNFGALCPESYALAQAGTDSSTMTTECLIEGRPNTKLKVKVRFLHLLTREVAEIVDCDLPSGDCTHLIQAEHHFQFVPVLDVNRNILQTWQEAVEREVDMPPIDLNELEQGLKISEFSYPSNKTSELLTNEDSGEVVGLIVRTQQEINGSIEISLARVSEENEVFRLSTVIRNCTAFDAAQSTSRDEALMRSFVSTHTILEMHDGSFISLLEPPGKYKTVAAQCVNKGTFPVLVGEEGQTNCVLSSPIILYDYPQIAPQSAGDLFDGTEIDEILTLRIMTLTDEEKREMRSADELARQLLERTETMPPEQLMKLHGVMKRSQ